MSSSSSRSDAQVSKSMLFAALLIEEDNDYDSLGFSLYFRASVTCMLD